MSADVDTKGPVDATTMDDEDKSVTITAGDVDSSASSKVNEVDEEESNATSQFMSHFMQQEMPELNNFLAKAEASLTALDMHPLREKKKKDTDEPAAPAADSSDDSDDDAPQKAARGRGRGAARGSRGGRGRGGRSKSGVKRPTTASKASEGPQLTNEQNVAAVRAFAEQYDSHPQWTFLVDTLDRLYLRGSMYTRVASVLSGVALLDKAAGRLDEAEKRLLKVHQMCAGGHDKLNQQRIRVQVSLILWQILAQRERFEEAMPYFRERVWFEFATASAESSPAAQQFIRTPGPQLLSMVKVCVPPSPKKLQEYVSMLIIGSKLGLAPAATPSPAPAAPASRSAAADDDEDKTRGSSDEKKEKASDPDRERLCSFCRCTETGSGVKFLLCGKCKSAIYCSALCQKAHWKKGGHKQECESRVAQQAAQAAQAAASSTSSSSSSSSS